ncbi:hypothetical protein EI42_03660 [Thermosporothrix hazakensis]|jgi:hypothetical protein|uniref:Uncharacterized protein n=2 Tax=Thermosporothrix TaxID=768650 RepID=A0A326U5I9_THEHA|nr:hypothetical protein [Thermosporothrix hazakensis]PZW27097.1 hypothetical protein EI42_03660 [Thermosporothrix hazakensis]
MMEFEDTLRNCLQAVQSRFPTNLIEVNQDVLGERVFSLRYRSTLEVVAWLEHTDPALLEEPAKVVVSAQKCEIVLPGRSPHPAFWLYHRGNMPDRTEVHKAQGSQEAP